MDSFPRLLPFLYPYRYRLVGSLVLGLLIAALWGANLTVAFPVVKVLLEHKNLHEYVQETIDDATAHEERLVTELATLETQLSDLKAQQIPESHPDYQEITHSQIRKQQQLATKRSTLYQYRWLDWYVMPIVPSNEFQTLCWLLVVVLVATAIKGLLTFFQDMLVGIVAESAVMSIRKKMLEKTLDLDYQSLSMEGQSGLMARFTYDAEQLLQGIALLGGKAIREPLKCLACMIGAFYVNWQLTLLSLIFIPMLGLFLSKFGKMLKQASRRMMESMSQIYKVLEETFDGLKVVIGFNNATYHRKLFDSQYESYFKKSIKLLRVDSAAKPLLELLGLLAMFVAMIPGTYLVLRGKTEIWGIRLSSDVMDAAQLFLLYTMLVGMLDPCRKMSSTFGRLKRCTAAIDRVFHLIDQPSLITDPVEPKACPRHQESIEFQDVSFRYASKEMHSRRALALEHVDLKVDFGEVLAIVGQNGCGKSTLLNMLPRFYDPEAGDVLIDGHSLKDVTLADLRNQIGVVTQETVLFDGTVVDNIRYGTPNATMAEVEEAARKAHVMPIIQSLPQGFETKLGDKGKELSGGQRQRIAFARVILRDPAILILDEATSAADAESESLIHQTLKDFVKGRTTFVISHTISQSLLDFVTRIVVMESGQVVATGTHEELLRMCPLYHRLYHAPARQISEGVKKNDVVKKAA